MQKTTTIAVMIMAIVAITIPATTMATAGIGTVPDEKKDSISIPEGSIAEGFCMITPTNLDCIGEMHIGYNSDQNGYGTYHVVAEWDFPDDPDVIVKDMHGYTMTAVHPQAHYGDPPTSHFNQPGMYKWYLEDAPNINGTIYIIDEF